MMLKGFFFHIAVDVVMVRDGTPIAVLQERFRRAIMVRAIFGT